MVLNKTQCLYARDEHGELVPQTVTLVIDEDNEEQLELKGETIVITPLVRGEIKRLFGNEDESKDKAKDLDSEIIEKHCVDPSFSKDEILALKPTFANAIVTTIMSESGLDSKKNRKLAVKAKEDEFSKN